MAFNAFLPFQQSYPLQALDFGRVFLGSLFRVSVDGRLPPVGFFSGISGLSIEYALEETTARGPNGGPAHTTKHVASAKYGDITLSRGMSPDNRLMAWLEEWEMDTARRYTASIDVLGPIGGRLAPALDTFELEGVWPVSWTAGKLEAKSDSPVTEELVLAADEVRRKAKSPI